MNFGRSKSRVFSLNKYFLLFPQKLETSIIVERMVVELELRAIFFTYAFENLRDSNNPLQIVPAYFHFQVSNRPPFLFLVVLEPPLVFSFGCQVSQMETSHNEIGVVFVGQLHIVLFIVDVLVDFPIDHEVSHRSQLEHLPGEHLDVPIVYL